jgi:ABC-2 type transport system ATP-binding protein
VERARTRHARIIARGRGAAEGALRARSTIASAAIVGPRRGAGLDRRGGSHYISSSENLDGSLGGDGRRVIEVKDLRKLYGSFEALRGVSFSVAAGEVVGFLGPNGAGKTTTMKILTGFLRQSSGRAVVGGCDVLEDPLGARRRVGYLPESAPLYQDMQPREYLAFMADVRAIPRGERARRVGEVAERCGIEDVLAVPIGELSKGYRQRVGLAQALLHRPDILILDEPTSGLDPNQIVGIRALLREIGREKTVILSTHILREVEVTCGRVLIVSGGRIVADAAPGELERGDSLVVAARGAGEDVVRAALAAALHVVAVERLEAGRWRLKTDGAADAGAEVFQAARDKGFVLSEIRPENATLEDVFHELTGVN